MDASPLPSDHSVDVFRPRQPASGPFAAPRCRDRKANAGSWELRPDAFTGIEQISLIITTGGDPSMQ